MFYGCAPPFLRARPGIIRERRPDRAQQHQSAVNKLSQMDDELAPTPGPTAGLYSHGSVNVMMLTAFTTSIVLRSGIGVVCLRRLWDYR